MLLIYNLALFIYGFSIRIAALFKPKAKQWIAGRHNIFEKISATKRTDNQPLVWIHASSLGEFEQGRPIIESIRKDHPHSKILLTFFSPSGYEIRKDYELVDHVFYLPMDSASNAKKFIQLVQPTLVIFIKYDLWYHYLNELQKAKTPTILISATFRKNQFFFRSYGAWFKPVIERIDQIFVQNESSKKVLSNHGISNSIVAGDTRVDRVSEIAASGKINFILEQFTKGKKTLIAGSTWPADEAILKYSYDQLKDDWKFIIAPHDISEARIQYIENFFDLPSIRFSQVTNADLNAYNLLIIDNIGMLSSSYKYADIAFVGGAFGTGLHNTLEPIAFGIPVIFGAIFHKFEEARWLIENGGGFSVNSAQDCYAVIQQLENPAFFQKSANNAFRYIDTHKGATKKIMKWIDQSCFLKDT